MKTIIVFVALVNVFAVVASVPTVTKITGVVHTENGVTKIVTAAGDGYRIVWSDAIPKTQSVKAHDGEVIMTVRFGYAPGTRFVFVESVSHPVKELEQ